MVAGQGVYPLNNYPLQYQTQLASAQIPASNSSSQSGTYFTPEQQAMAQKLFGYQTSLLDKMTGYLDKAWGMPSPTGGTGGTSTGGGDFASYFNNIAGATPTSFTDIPIKDVFTPQMLQQQVNNLFATGQAGAGASALGLFSARPGMGVTPEALTRNAALLDAGTRAGIANAYMNKIPSLMLQNADQVLQQRVAQTNVENSRLNQLLQQGQLALGARGQDIQNALGQGRLAVDAQGNLLRTLSGFGSGSGGFGGFLSPLSYSQSASTSGPSAGSIVRRT